MRRARWKGWAVRGAAVIAGCAAMAGTANARPGGEQVDLILQGHVAPRCAFVRTPTALAIDADTDAATSSPLGLTCNLASESVVQLTVASSNGALLDANEATALRYAVTWAIEGTRPVDDFVVTAQPASFPIAAGAPGTSRSGILSIRLLDPAGPILAGSYGDQLVFTLSP